MVTTVVVVAGVMIVITVTLIEAGPVDVDVTTSVETEVLFKIPARC